METENTPTVKTATENTVVSWICPLCKLSSRQKSESSYERHLQDLHIEQLEEQERRDSEWKQSLTKQAFYNAQK
jgi:hypothetical protein